MSANASHEIITQDEYQQLLTLFRVKAVNFTTKLSSTVACLQAGGAAGLHRCNPGLQDGLRMDAFGVELFFDRRYKSDLIRRRHHQLAASAVTDEQAV